MSENNRTVDCIDYEGFQTSGTNHNPEVPEIRLNELAAGALTKTVDTAVAVTQFAVGVPVGMAQITLEGANQLFKDGTETINSQFKSMINRIFKVRG